MGRAIVLVALMLGCVPALHAGQIQIVQWYDLNLWRYPDPPQDPNNLPSDPSQISYSSATIISPSLSNPFDDTYSGVTPLGGDHYNGYSFHVVGDSNFTQLRAAFEASFTDFAAANHTPGLYLDENGSVGLDLNLNLGHASSVVEDSINISGASGKIPLTIVFDVQGSVQADGGFFPGSSAFPSGYGQLFLGSEDRPVESVYYFDQTGALHQQVSLTTSVLAGSDSFFQYGLSFTGYLPDPNQVSADSVFDGILSYDFAHTVEVSKLILTLPPGTDVSKVAYQFGSGTNHNVEIRVANAVPEPSSACLLLAAAACCGIPRLLLRPGKRGGDRSAA